MKAIGVAGTAAAVLLFGSMMPIYAQREGGEKHEEKQARPQEQHGQQPQHAQQSPPQQRPQQARQAEPARQQEPRQPQAVTQQRGQQPQRQPQQQTQQQPRAQQTQQARQQPQPQRSQEQARTWQRQKGWAQQGGGSQGHATFAQDRAQNWSSDHRTWAQRGGYGGYYIPQDRFNVSFGSQHFFRLGALPEMYLGYPRFSYGGFSFLLLDPWPGDWPGNWYSADDVYVDYDNGYYLYNRSYPQERLAITIEL